MLPGKWTYRSFRNTAELVTQSEDSVTPLVVFEGVLDLVDDGPGEIGGAIGTADGLALTVAGRPITDGVDEYALTAKGIDGTPTAGWTWEIRGVLTARWLEAAAPPTFVGVVEHAGAGPVVATSTASFVAVRHHDDPPPRTQRRNALARDL